jgi:hypothetical protein
VLAQKNTHINVIHQREKILTVRVINLERVHDGRVKGESPADGQQAQEGRGDLPVAEGAADLIVQLCDGRLGQLRGA